MRHLIGWVRAQRVTQHSATSFKLLGYAAKRAANPTYARADEVIE